MKKVNRNTRAGKHGTMIECPNCEHRALVFHFSWSALGCTQCKGMIEKSEWSVV